MGSNKNILGLLDEAEASPSSVGLDLRLDLAAIVMSGINQRRWSQKDLAIACGMKPSFISRIVHSDANCEFETAGRILHALGIRATLVPVLQIDQTDSPIQTTNLVESNRVSNGQEISEEAWDETGLYGESATAWLEPALAVGHQA